MVIQYTPSCLHSVTEVAGCPVCLSSVCLSDDGGVAPPSPPANMPAGLWETSPSEASYPSPPRLIGPRRPTS